MTCGEQQGLLAAHARAERIDALRFDSQPRNGPANDLRHPGEVLDLPGVTPGKASESAALPLRVHDRERAERRQVAPASDVLLGRDAASMRRDDERQRWIVAGLFAQSDALAHGDDHIPRWPCLAVRFHACPRSSAVDTYR